MPLSPDVSQDSGSGQDWRVLLIDDEPDIREIIHLSLTDAGYHVICASNGIQGLEILAAQSPQILITDIKMPGISGLEVLERAKASHPETEVIVTTGFADIEKATIALRNDASDFITKPVDDTRLHLAMDRAVRRYRDRKALADYTRLLENENLKTSAELIQNINYQTRLIENSMDGILGCDDKNRIVTYNKTMQALLGYPKHEVVHAKVLDDFFSPDDFMALKQNLVRQGYGGRDRLFLYETFMKGRDRERLPVQISGSLVIQEDQTRGLVLFIRDLRKIRELEQAVQGHEKILHREKMMSLGRLAASMVHEINNPLSGILNYIRLMIRLADQSPMPAAFLPRFKEYLEIVEQETSRCADLVSGLLKFSRQAKPEFALVDTGELVRYSLMLCNHRLELSNIQVTARCDPGLPKVLGDFNGLQQCLINLVFNASAAILAAGRGGGSGKTAGHLQVETGAAQDRKWICIHVRDDGRGISPSDLPYIFEPFFTTKPEGYGVGLGLSTAYGIIERHRGRIDVESEPGKGSCFTIKLPPLTEDADLKSLDRREREEENHG